MGLGLVIFGAMLPGFGFIVLGMVLAGVMGQAIVAGIGIAAGVVWILGVSLVSSAVQSILLTALYLYASEGTAPPQFDTALLQRAFDNKR
jgi:membrane protein implicated in regulation of membrane protease activity